MRALFSLPEYIQDVLICEDYDIFIEQMKGTYELTPDQTDALDAFVFQIFKKEIAPKDITQWVQATYGFTAEKSLALTKDLILNTALVFPDYFGDQKELYRTLGGNPEADMAGSRIALALEHLATEAVIEGVEEASRDFDPEKEKSAMKALFQEKLIEHYYVGDSYKPALNNSLLLLLQMFEGYEQELLNALYANTQKIGNISLSGEESTVGNLIKDFLAFSQGEATTIALAKYLTQSPAVKKLHERDRDAVRKLMETFLTLKNFPESLNKMSPEQWMIIPYEIAEKPILSEDSRRKLQDLKMKSEANLGNEVVLSAAIQPQSLPSVPESLQSSPPLVTEKPAQPASVLKFIPTQIFSGDYTALAKDILIQSGVLLPPDIKSKTEKVIVTRMRTIRNRVESRENLIDVTSGPGLTGQDADRILDLSEQAIQILHVPEVAKEVVPTPPPAPIPPPPLPQAQPVQDPHPAFSSVIKYDTSHTPQSPISQVESPPVLTSGMEIKDVDGVPTLVEKKAVSLSSAPSPVKSEGHSIPVIVRSGPSHTTQRTSVMADVRQSPTMDAIEEFRSFSLKDFRRLSADPAEAVKKIAQKLQALQKESFSKMIAAIESWKQSEVHMLYLAMGQEQLAKGVALTHVIADRLASAQPALTEQEFDALVELNETLRVS